MKRGPKPLPKKEVRKSQLKVYVNEAQRKLLAKAAEESGQTLSTYVLNCSLHVSEKLTDKDVLKKSQKKIREAFKVKSIKRKKKKEEPLAHHWV